MRTVYGIYYVNFDYTDWGYSTQETAIKAAKKTGFEYILRETTGYLEDYL
jgi:hypothetical protein